MKSIRDLVRKLPEDKEGLEAIVRKYDPEINEAIEKNPQYKRDLEYVVDKTFDKYKAYLGGLAHKISSAGHAVGHTADAWLAGTGDMLGTLGGKFIHFLAQLPEMTYSTVYAMRTGDYRDSFQRIFEGFLSYLPGFTIADQGLSRIVQKRMIKDAIKKTREKLGLEYKPWNEKYAEDIKDKYTDVQDRRDNVIKVDFRKGKEIRKAA